MVSEIALMFTWVSYSFRVGIRNPCWCRAVDRVHGIDRLAPLKTITRYCIITKKMRCRTRNQSLQHITILVYITLQYTQQGTIWQVLITKSLDLKVFFLTSVSQGFSLNVFLDTDLVFYLGTP